MEIQLAKKVLNTPRIKVVGIGGCGCNSVEYLMDQNIQNIEYICINTDAQNLKFLQGKETKTLQIGSKLTRGQGAGGDPEIGHQAALEDKELIRDALLDSDLVFITAGMGGGTGTGASQLIALMAKELRILTISLIYRPFNYEKGRIKIATKAASELSKSVDSQIVIFNQELAKIANVTAVTAYAHGYKVLETAVRSIADIITVRGQINVDFADVRSIIKVAGNSVISTGFAMGEDAAVNALKDALKSHIMEYIELNCICQLLINVTSNRKVKQMEINKLNDFMYDETPDSCVIVAGHVYDDALESDAIKVSIIMKGSEPIEQNTELLEQKETLAKVVNGNMSSERGGKTNTVAYASPTTVASPTDVFSRVEPKQDLFSAPYQDQDDEIPYSD